MATPARETDKYYDELRSEVDTLRKDLQSVTQTIRELAASESRAARERLRQSATEAQAKGREAIESVGPAIGEHPFTSVATAFGVGLVVGALLNRRQ